VVLGEQDAIVCVGDGSTPRTAALFAYRLPHVQCYSIDPALVEHTTNNVDGEEKNTILHGDLDDIQTIEGSTSLDNKRICIKMKPNKHPWGDIDRLHVVPHKIENVQLTCRRAVIILMHAHVDMADVSRAIVHTPDDDHHSNVGTGVVGVIAAPCCNFGARQAFFHGYPPDFVFTDSAMLSEKNEIRIWAATASLGQDSVIGKSSVATGGAEVALTTPASLTTGTASRNKSEKKQRGIEKQRQNVESRRLRDQLRAKHMEVAAVVSPEIGIPSSPVKDVISMALCASPGSLLMLPEKHDSIDTVLEKYSMISDGENHMSLPSRQLSQVDLLLVKRLRFNFKQHQTLWQGKDGQIFRSLTLVQDKDCYFPVMRVQVQVTGKKYESAFLLILNCKAVNDDINKLSINEDLLKNSCGSIQLVLAKRFFAGGDSTDATQSIGTSSCRSKLLTVEDISFDGMRNTVRSGDVVQVEGCPGRTSFGEPSLFSWDLSLLEMSIPQDVIHTLDTRR
jgi:hypothetical protein